MIWHMDHENYALPDIPLFIIYAMLYGTNDWFQGKRIIVFRAFIAGNNVAVAFIK